MREEYGYKSIVMVVFGCGGCEGVGVVCLPSSHPQIADLDLKAILGY